MMPSLKTRRIRMIIKLQNTTTVSLASNTTLRRFMSTEGFVTSSSLGLRLQRQWHEE